MVFRQQPSLWKPLAASHPVDIAPRTRRWLWSGIPLNVMAASWMISTGDRLDTASSITAVITLGGHHRVVLGLAIAGFVMLAVLALLTGGFTAARPVQQVALTMAGIVSIVALAGVLSVAAFVVGLVLLAALLFGGRPGRR
jgi:hypothetical protein